MILKTKENFLIYTQQAAPFIQVQPASAWGGSMPYGVSWASGVCLNYQLGSHIPILISFDECEVVPSLKERAFAEQVEPFLALNPENRSYGDLDVHILIAVAQRYGDYGRWTGRDDLENSDETRFRVDVNRSVIAALAACVRSQVPFESLLVAKEDGTEDEPYAAANQEFADSVVEMILRLWRR